MMKKQLAEIYEVYANAELLYCEAEVEEALNRMAADITTSMAATNPIILCVMIGGMVTCGKLLTRLNFPLQLDYIHASRYRNQTSGGEIDWIGKLPGEIAGRHILIVDDILDEGHTLSSIIDFCRNAGATEVFSAVLLDKSEARIKAVTADFTGFTIPNRYVFGYGMDYKSFLRNAAGIYSVNQSS